MRREELGVGGALAVRGAGGSLAWLGEGGAAGRGQHVVAVGLNDRFLRRSQSDCLYHRIQRSAVLELVVREPLAVRLRQRWQGRRGLVSSCNSP